MNLKYSETTRFQNLWNRGKKKKKKKKKKKEKKKGFVSPYPTDPLKMTLTQNIFSLKPMDFSFIKIYILQLEEFSVLFCYF